MPIKEFLFYSKMLILFGCLSGSVSCLPSAQVMISGVLGSSPMLGSLLSGESASPHAHVLFLK